MKEESPKRLSCRVSVANLYSQETVASPDTVPLSCMQNSTYQSMLCIPSEIVSRELDSSVTEYTCITADLSNNQSITLKAAGSEIN